MKFTLRERIFNLRESLRPVIRWWMETRARIGRGDALGVFFRDKWRAILNGTVYIMAIQNLIDRVIAPVFGIDLTIPESWYFTLLVGWPIYQIFRDYFMGYISQKYGFWKMEGGFQARKIDPTIREMLVRLERIEKGQYGDTYKPSKEVQIWEDDNDEIKKQFRVQEADLAHKTLVEKRIDKLEVLIKQNERQNSQKSYK